MREIPVGKEVVFREPHRPSAEPFGFDNEVESPTVDLGPRTGPRLGVAEVEIEPDLHDMRPTIAS